MSRNEHISTSSGMNGGTTAGGSANSPQSISMASISSEGSVESPLVEQEEIAALTHDVRNFKEALGKLRKLFHADWIDKEKSGAVRVAIHERLGEVLRILRNILERYPALQSTELLVTAGALIQQVKGHDYEDEHQDPKEFFESIDQLALAFSSRVSEYLMGDLDTNISISSSVSSKAKSCENIASDAETGGGTAADKERGDLSPRKIDGLLLLLEQGVDFALQHAKLWSKYAKDVMMYVEKRSHIEMEYAKNLSKLSMTVRPLIGEECNLPFQSIYCTALDNDVENSNSSQITCSLLLGKKFLEPLSAQRVEHEKMRKQVKELWHKEVAHTHKIIGQMQKARGTYLKCHREWEQLCEETQRCVGLDQSTQGKSDKKRLIEDEVMQKALEAEATYKASVVEANECHARMQKIKSTILQRIRESILQSDYVIKTVTIAYFQLQHTLNAPLPTQFRTLCEKSQLYSPGSEYAEFVKKLPPTNVTSQKDPLQMPFNFEPHSKGSLKLLDQERKSTDSIESDELFRGKEKFGGKHIAAYLGSDTDSITSSQSNKSHEPSPTSTHKLVDTSSFDEIGTNYNDAGYLSYTSGQKHCISKAAETHTFRKLKTPSRCRECDSYVYFQGCECIECGLACHKKCLESLAIQCGHKRLPRKMTTFGVDLGQHLMETSTLVPHIVSKCVHEIDSRGRLIKGIYRVSGVKSKVEKLCQAFENGAELVDLTDIHPNVIANVLKLYLRQLPEPLLTFCLYPEFVRIAKDGSSDSTNTGSVIEDLKELVRKLPCHHYLTLATLMQHLQRVANEADVNNMPPSNLGIVFGPTLLRTAEGSASLNSLVDTVHQTRAIELMIANAHSIFGPQDIATARERASAEAGFNLEYSASFSNKNKQTGSADSMEAIHQHSIHATGDEISSDDEENYFLFPGELPGNKHILHEAMPKVFKGSLKDYQGLEGLSLMASQGAGCDVQETYEKPRKTASIDMEEKLEEKTKCTNTVTSEKERQKKQSDNPVGEDWPREEIARKPFQLTTQRTESSADSDYSFESHASSSVESRSPRELEESCETFSELPRWFKRNPTAVLPSTYRSPSTSLDGAEVISTSYTTGSTAITSEHTTTVNTGANHSTYIPARIPSTMTDTPQLGSYGWQDVTSLLECAERANMEMRTSYHNETKYSDLDEKKSVSVQVAGKVTTPLSSHSTFSYTEASSVTMARKSSKTEQTNVTCVEELIESIDSD